MNLPFGKLNFGLDLDLDIETQEKTIANDSKWLYKLKFAKRFEHLIFGHFILEVTNGLFMSLFFYFLSMSKTFSVKIII